MGLALAGVLVFAGTRSTESPSGRRLESRPEPHERWVDSVLSRMTLDEKIGQLLMPYAFGEEDFNNTDTVLRFIRDYHIGGVMLGGGATHETIRQVNAFQKASKIPLLISIDGEWGVGMRIDSSFHYPWNMTLGAVNDTGLVYEVGRRMALQCKRLGIQINFAPVVDVNVNAANPIVGNRSFGSDPRRVADRAIALMKGMQDEGVLTSAKHFPGHGATDRDSHLELPVLPYTRGRLDSIELYPFKKLVEAGVGSVMVGHLSVSALEPNPKIPSSLSRRVVTDLLKGEMGFDGLVFTDALEMKGVSGFYPADEAAVRALLAGDDVLLENKNPGKMFAAIKKGLQEGKISRKRIDRSVRKVLQTKYRLGLNRPVPALSAEGLVADLNTEADSALYLAVMEKAVTLLRNRDGVLPFMETGLDAPLYWVRLGEGESATFGEYLRRYAPVIEIDGNERGTYDLAQLVPDGARVVVSYHNFNRRPISLKPQLSKENQKKITALSRKGRNVLVLFSMPYGLLDWDGYEPYEGLVVAYQNATANHIAVAEMLFGAIAPEGSLPVTLSDKFRAGYGLTFEPVDRLKYGYPSQAGMSPEKIAEMDRIVREVVESKAAPAVQVLIARHGRVIYDRCYGSADGEGEEPNRPDRIYDMASVTKIMATLPVIMKMVQEKALSLDDRLGDRLPYLKGTNKESLLVRDLLTHTAGLQDWIPYYLETLDADGRPSPEYYRPRPEGEFTLPVTEYLYARRSAADSLRRRIVASPVSPEKKYVYSDLAFMFLQEIAERHYGRPLNEIVQEAFYGPVGAWRTGYLPLERFDREEIIPSEKDTYWRHGLVQGYVHDMTAPFRGGVSGHAGLFSTADDMAKMGQMYLNGGHYGGRRYIDSALLRAFSACQDCDKGFYRGLGFDRPGPRNRTMSQQAFGHTGFTGTCVWIDPQYDLVYVFLSNRTFLSMNDNTLSRLGLRGRIQQAAVDAIVR